MWTVLPNSDHMYALFIEKAKQGIKTLEYRGLNARAEALKANVEELDEVRSKRKALKTAINIIEEQRKVRIEITRNLIQSTTMKCIEIALITGISTEDVLEIKKEISARN